jgi:hypothetical protein
MTKADLVVKSLGGARRRNGRRDCAMIELRPVKRQEKGGFLPR